MSSYLRLCCCRKQNRYLESNERCNEAKEKNRRHSFQKVRKQHEAHQRDTESVETQYPSSLNENEEVIYTRNGRDLQKYNIVDTKSIAVRDGIEEKDKTLKEAQTPLQEKDARAPGQPIIVHVTSDSVEITWNIPSASFKIDYFEIRYKCVIEKHWETKKTEDGEINGAKVDYLNSSMQYHFKVRAVCNDIEGPYSPTSETVETRQSLASKIKKSATLIQQGNPQKYKIAIQAISHYRDRKSRCVAADLQKHVDQKCVLEKTILLIGATGAGKSTLLDGIMNYIAGVSLNDDFRFSLVDLVGDEKLRSGDQTKSQQDWVTNYKIPCMIDSRIAYTVNVIDTPGIGDNRGVARDRYLVEQMKDFFDKRGMHGVDTIDAVCFVTPASSVRITASQMYIFDFFLSVFGQDILSNIVIMVTFSDGSEPSVLQALKKAAVPFRKHFVFNNSAICAKPSDTFTKDFWKMGWDSFNLFFEELRQMETRSLKLTLEVLKMRGQLESAVSILMPRIPYILNKINEKERHKKNLEEYINKMEQNKNYKYKEMQLRHVHIPLPRGRIVTNCQRCDITCHRDCSLDELSKRKGLCIVLGKTGICHFCNCDSEKHAMNHYLIRVIAEYKDMEYEDMQQRYQSAVRGMQETKHILSKMNYELRYLQKEVRETIRRINSLSNQLKEIALKQNPLSDVQYVELLIESENKQKKPGYLERIKVLQEVKEHADLTSKVQQNPNIDLFPLETLV